MPRSSESIAALAAALAKAQQALVNPEKTLTAVLHGGRLAEGQRSFRYAPLASGLDIVRKVLGQHEIALLQTTAVDPGRGMIHLTTTLAHASGEWIASEWPVCSTADFATPQRMGAALTYARRYALFTLVGIAGEDDLDAPDLPGTTPTASGTISSAVRSPAAQLRQPSQTNRLERAQPPSGNRANAVGEPMGELDSDQSALLRDRLIQEICELTSAESAAQWAQAALPSKNCLVASDAQLVEEAFSDKVSIMVTASSTDDTLSPVLTATEHTGTAETTGHRKRIDKSVLQLAEPRRYRNKAHLRFVAQHPCLVCARKPSDPHHLRFMQPRALGLKVSDEFTVPLCRTHHRALHRAGDERAWWAATGIDPTVVANHLWSQTRGTQATLGNSSAAFD